MHKRILIVEDSPTSTLALAALVKSLGFDVDVVSEGERAVIKAACNSYAVILMDLRLPGQDGFATAKAIRADGNNVPIVSVTAYPLTSDGARCTEAGIDDFVGKGYRRDELERVIMLWAKSKISKDLRAASGKRSDEAEKKDCCMGGRG